MSTIIYNFVNEIIFLQVGGMSLCQCCTVSGYYIVIGGCGGGGARLEVPLVPHSDLIQPSGPSQR